MITNSTTTKVTGIDEAIREMRQFDKRAYFKIRNRMKKYTKFVEPQFQGAFSAFDYPSGFYHNGRTGIGKSGQRKAKVTMKIGGRRQVTDSVLSGRTTERPLFSVRLDSAPHAIVDMANSGQLGDVLPGQASRVMWPMAERLKAPIVANVTWAVQKTANETNVRLRAGAY